MRYTGRDDVDGALEALASIETASVVKLGARGAAAVVGGRVTRSAAFPALVVDTTGRVLSDAGYLFGSLPAASASPTASTSATPAGRCASVTKAGGSTAFPSREELLRFIEPSWPRPGARGEGRMKLTVLGGAGVRAVFLAGASPRAPRGRASTSCASRRRSRRLSLVARSAPSPRSGPRSGPPGSEIRLRVEAHADLDEALDGAGAVISTFRVGGDDSRVGDELLARKYGLLPQETDRGWAASSWP